MGILNHDEIVRRLQSGQLIRAPRRKPAGEFDVEPASYDLTAGKAVWRQPTDGANRGDVAIREYKPSVDRPTVTVHPGQMIFVITHEDILMPLDLCGTVYSKNNLAAKGILALNAGHVDPGYEGPIVIRLINLRAMPWTLQLGEPIFTVVFQTLDVQETDHLVAQPPISAEATLKRVIDSADAALSNALLDLYEGEMAKRENEMRNRLHEHYSSVEERIRSSLTENYLKRTEFGNALWLWLRGSIVGVALVLATLLGLAASVVKLLEFIRPVTSNTAASPIAARSSSSQLSSVPPLVTEATKTEFTPTPTTASATPSHAPSVHAPADVRKQ